MYDVNVWLRKNGFAPLPSPLSDAKNSSFIAIQVSVARCVQRIRVCWGANKRRKFSFCFIFFFRSFACLSLSRFHESHMRFSSCNSLISTFGFLIESEKKMPTKKWFMAARWNYRMEKCNILQFTIFLLRWKYNTNMLFDSPFILLRLFSRYSERTRAKKKKKKICSKKKEAMGNVPAKGMEWNVEGELRKKQFKNEWENEFKCNNN